MMEIEVRISGTMENLFHFEGEGVALKRPSALARALSDLGKDEKALQGERAGADLVLQAS